MNSTRRTRVFGPTTSWTKALDTPCRGRLRQTDERTVNHAHRSEARQPPVSAGSVRIGTVFRPDTMRQYAIDAGFTTVETLEVDHPQFVPYRLH